MYKTAEIDLCQHLMLRTNFVRARSSQILGANQEEIPFAFLDFDLAEAMSAEQH